MPRRLPIVMARAAVAVVTAALTLLLAEVAVRLIAPVPDLFPRWQWDALPAGWDGYTADSDLGYRPVFGGGEYSEFGTVINEYPAAKREGVERVLFLGDSVTHRWRIQQVFVLRCRASPVEFWNAGVEGFNTAQEVEYYLRWNHRIAPDHVTLVFHNNDFIATPVLFRDDEGKVVVANPQASISRTDIEIAGLSHLYRHYLRVRISRMQERDPVTGANETRAALARLKRELDENGIGFNVILVPVIKPPEEWNAYEKRSRALSLEILEELGIPFHDLIQPFTAAARSGIELSEGPGDEWHPSDEVARRFARHLIRDGYLESVLGPGACEAGNAARESGGK